MVATVGSISIDLSTNVAKFASGFRGAATTVDRESARMSRGIAVAENSLKNFVRTGAAAFAGGFGAREIQRYADAWTSAGNQIRAVGEVTGTQVRSLEELNDIANETRAGLGETVTLYARLIQATSALGKSEKEVAQATEIVNKAFKAGGASAQEQAAGILQLSQALGSGVLQGDELRSLRENAPLIAKAIADEFGTTIGGLKDLGAEGALTADRVFKAILNAQSQIEGAFEQTNATIGDAFTKLTNNLTQAIGKLDAATGASAAFVAEINNIANAIEEFGNTPGLDQFLNLFGLKLVEGGAADQLRDFFNGMGEQSQRTSDEIKADIAEIEAQLAELKIQGEAGFDVGLQTDRAQEELKALQDELRNVEIVAKTAANNASGSLAGLADSAIKAIDKVSNKALPKVTRFSNDAPAGGTSTTGTQGRREVNGVGVRTYGGNTPSSGRSEVNGVGVRSFTSTDATELREATTAAGDRVYGGVDSLNDDVRGYLEDLGGEIDTSVQSLNDVWGTGVQVFYKNLSDAIRTSIVTGMAEGAGDRQQYTSSTFNAFDALTGPRIKQLDAEIERIQQLSSAVGTLAADAINLRIADLESERAKLSARPDLPGMNVSYAGAFADGGSFTVGGAQTGDRNLVTFLANEGERVSVMPPGQTDRPIVLNYYAAAGESERTARQNARIMLEEMQTQQRRS